MEKRIKPIDALNAMCHISDRKFGFNIYTISDQRFPKYNGKQIKQEVIQGKYIYTWIKTKK